MTDEYLEGIMNRDNPDNENLSNVPCSICPISIYFEGDEDKCDPSKCDFEDRRCSRACEIGPKELQKEVDKIKLQPKEEMTVVAPLMLIDNEIFDAKGRLIAKVWREDIGECLCTNFNNYPRLAEELANFKEGCEGLKLAIQDLRSYADCYKRVCESLGIKKDILTYIEKLKQQRDDLLTACKNALPLIAGDRIKYDVFEPDNDLGRHLVTLIRKSEKELEAAIDKVEKGIKQ